MVLNVIKSERQIKAYEVGVGGDIKEKKEREKHKRRMWNVIGYTNMFPITRKQ